MTTPGLRYHVTVAFRQGYGQTFGSRSAALEYAERELHRLRAEHSKLEHEDFGGIYCELAGTQQVWRFEYDQGGPVWMRVNEQASSLLSRLSAERRGLRSAPFS